MGEKSQNFFCFIYVGEAERIRSFNGRIRALRHEPSVKRVWLPHHNAPGLAMSRVLGDFCLKRYGVISEPDFTHRRLTANDMFVVLATDGVSVIISY
jgi:serine/threonine protein phosphatase PrpC